MPDNVNGNMDGNETNGTHAAEVPSRCPASFAVSMGGKRKGGLTPKRLARRLQRLLDSVAIAGVSYDVDYVSASAYGTVCEALDESCTYAEQGIFETVIGSGSSYGGSVRKFCDGFMDEYDAFKRDHADASASDAVSAYDRIVVVRRIIAGDSDSTAAVFTVKVLGFSRSADAAARMAEAKAATDGLREAFGIGEGDSEVPITVEVDGSVRRSLLRSLSDFVDGHIDSDHDVIRLVAIGTTIGAIISALTGGAGTVPWMVVAAMFWIAYHLGDFGGDGLVLDMILKLDSVGLLVSQPNVTLRHSNTTLYLLIAIVILGLLYPLT